jgi:hypothetical protein
MQARLFEESQPERLARSLRRRSPVVYLK